MACTSTFCRFDKVKKNGLSTPNTSAASHSQTTFWNTHCRPLREGRAPAAPPWPPAPGVAAPA
ncbi:MAG: hypothetical protein VB141_02035 [Burkholderia gladioli]